MLGVLVIAWKGGDISYLTSYGIAICNNKSWSIVKQDLSGNMSCSTGMKYNKTNAAYIHQGKVRNQKERSRRSGPEIGCRSTSGRLPVDWGLQRRSSAGRVPVDRTKCVSSRFGRSTAGRLVHNNFLSRSSDGRLPVDRQLKVVHVVHIGRVIGRLPVDRSSEISCC